MERRIKVLLAKLGLDVHNRGLITVAKELRDAGMEVIYVGNSLPDEILSTAIQEDVDLVGVSSLGGAHLSLGTQLIERAERQGLSQDMAFMIGGVFSPRRRRGIATSRVRRRVSARLHPRSDPQNHSGRRGAKTGVKTIFLL